MNKNFFAGLFVGLGLMAVVAFKPAEMKPDADVQKWEYKVHTTSGWPKREADLNAAGTQGWELIEIQGVYNIFKRPAQ